MQQGTARVAVVAVQVVLVDTAKLVDDHAEPGLTGNIGTKQSKQTELRITGTQNSTKELR